MANTHHGMPPTGSTMTADKTGVILLNMGGPDKLDDIRPFLYNLFSDRDIIRLGPSLLQRPLAWFISRRRAPKSRKIYQQIGGGSPLSTITNDQGQALEILLRAHGDYSVIHAMRYWQPDSDQALRTLAKRGINDIIALTLYPHYSCATTGSSLKELRRAMARSATNFNLRTIESWPTQVDYIKSLAHNILSKAASFAPLEPKVVYSAHSLPVSFIDSGDPYVDHIKASIHQIERITGLKGTLCFQSKSGPVKWLSPSTPETLDRLAHEGCKAVLMVPISFVSDHIETLYEIDILYRDQAQGLGMRLASSGSLNCDPAFIEGLKNLVLACSHST